MNKFLKYLAFAFVLFVFTTFAFAGGFLAGHYTPLADALPLPAAPYFLATPQAATEATPSDLQSLFSPFWEAWDLVHEKYVDQPVDDLALMRGAIEGMLAALGDQHTSYMDPQEYEDANASISGEYEGIGAYVDTSGEYLTVISPIPGSPAEKAGVRAGDVILAVDGEDVTGINPELVRRRVLGPAGQEIILTLQREGEEAPFDVSIIRAHITVASVEWEMKGQVAYIKINTFGESTTEELKTALTELMAQNPVGMVLDLRNNVGGYLQTSVEVASQFIGEGTILIERYGDGKEDVYPAQRGGMALDIPLVVLVNEATASASEIVSGAIQDYGRGQLVGVTTYGKGSVQIWTPLSDNQGAVRVTIAKWLTPNERTIHELGLTPDYVVEMTEEDMEAKRDPQLDKALELLNP